jgi:hypothetical protein
MRKAVCSLAVALALAAAYVASPFHAAWTLREAMKAGDAATLEHRIVWSSMRETLRQSLLEMADPSEPVAPELASTAPRKGVWARFKSYATRKTVDNLVTSYANPEDLPQLFTYGTTYRNIVHGPPEPKTLANLPARVREFWSRVHRAEFKSLTVFELEMQDKHTPDRRYTGLLELQGVTWKLTELRVHRSPPPAVVTADS